MLRVEIFIDDEWVREFVRDVLQRELSEMEFRGLMTRLEGLKGELYRVVWDQVRVMVKRWVCNEVKERVKHGYNL